MITARRVNYIPKEKRFSDISFIASGRRHNVIACHYVVSRLLVFLPF